MNVLPIFVHLHREILNRKQTYRTIYIHSHQCQRQISANGSYEMNMLMNGNSKTQMH